MTVPIQKPGRSEQSVGTPRVFLDAVERRFGKIGLDVAASHTNSVVDRYYTEEEDGLSRPWDGDLNWCNPPYSKIGPWVEKALTEREFGHASLLLLPAGVGSNWFRDFVHEKADVYFLNGRLTFVGHDTPYPKDLILLHYQPAILFSPQYAVWNWRTDKLT